MKVKSLNRVRPHGLQPTRLLCPWEFPGKGTGVGYIAFSGAHSEYLINVSQPPKLVSWAGPLLYFRCLVLRVQGELAWLTEDNCESETWKVTSSKERREGGRETEKGKEKKKGPARSLQER